MGRKIQLTKCCKRYLNLLDHRLACLPTDTLEMEMTYYKTDSVFNLVPQTDTISVFIRKARANPRAKKQESKAAKVVHYGFSTNANGTFEVYNPALRSVRCPFGQRRYFKNKVI